MIKNNFYNLKLSYLLKINIITSAIFYIISRTLLFIIQTLFKLDEINFLRNPNSTDSNILLIIILGPILSLLILILYSTLITFFIRIYESFILNLTSFIGIIVCNLAIALFLYFLTRLIFIPLIYIAILLILLFYFLTLKYNKIKLSTPPIFS